MKNLRDYLFESSDDDKKTENNEKSVDNEEQTRAVVESSYNVSLNFSGLDGKDDILKGLAEIDNVNVEGDIVTFTAHKDSIDDIDEVHNIIKNYVKTLLKSSKRASDENYAQKIKSFASKAAALDEYVDNVKNEEE